jgi:hypothetical protein
MKKFNDITGPTAEVTIHKKALKYALLKAYASDSENNGIKYRMKGGEFVMKNKVFSLSVSALLIVTLLFGFMFLSSNIFTPQAEAKEAVEKAFTKFRTLTPEEQANLEKKIRADMETSLEEAKNAKDLEIVPEKEITRFTPPIEAEEQHKMTFKADHVIGTEPVAVSNNAEGGVGRGNAVPGVRVAGDHGIMAPEGLKLLRYTDPHGRKTILGINEKDEAVMKMITLNKEDIKNMNVVTPENAEEHGFSVEAKPINLSD